jgi:hypothetical protein
MRSPLEIVGGQFDHALLTTYSFNLRFFEEWVLRALWAAEVRNVVVFVDSQQLGHALLDRAPSAAGRAYDIVSANSAKAAFHPKLLLVTGRNGARLCVSSANLTADGQLRNAESAIAFDTNLSGHTMPVLDAGRLFRRLSEDAPSHTAASVLAALAELPEDNSEESPYRLIHNIDTALIDAFPAGPTRAVAPFVDADGTAAKRLHERGSLTVVVDADQIAASTDFFTAPWTVDARCFDARLHGKAYDVATPAGRWTLVGSPNLSAPALLRPASAGNLEVAVAVTQDETIKLPSSEPSGESGVAERAAARLAQRHAESTAAAPGAFNAWEDESRIAVSGIPDGTSVERWSRERWCPFGTVKDGVVLSADPEVRPVRLRAVLSDGRLTFAVVAQPARLRARMRSRTGGRQTEAVERLPLDVETVKVLEEALSQLYALSELAAGEDSVRDRRLASLPRDTPPDTGSSLLDWAPRTPEEEPRVPSLYLKAWKGEPDALLALVSRVLRLDHAEAHYGEAEVGRERVDLEDLDQVKSDQDLEVESGDDERIQAVDSRELERYRRAFKQLFQRGRQFIDSPATPPLAAWAFTYLLRLLEELGTRYVETESRKESLMSRNELRGIALELLEAYLGRAERDPLSMAAARAHLAIALRDRSRYSRRDIERLETLAYEWASDLVAVSDDVPSPPKETVGIDRLAAIAQLEGYAERSQWSGVERKAADRLEVAWLEHDPWPMILGEAEFKNRQDSPVWELLAFAAPAGYSLMNPFGAIVCSSSSSTAFSIHVLICSPKHGLLVEGARRMVDGAWLERQYRASRSSVERLGGPTTLEATTTLDEIDGLEQGSQHLRAVVPLIESLASSVG